MLIQIKKFFYIFLFNSTLFLILVIGIQNSANKKKVNLIISETVKLPISFIIGVSFITGSISSNLLKIDLSRERD